MLCVAALSTCGFLAVTAFVFDANGVSASAAAFDGKIAQSFEQMRTQPLTGRVMEVSALGSAPVLAVFSLLAYSAILRAGDRMGFVHLSIAILGASVWSRLLQHLFERERPENLLPFLTVTEGSYPSAHLFGAAACYATFAFFHARYAPRLRTQAIGYAVAFVLVLLIGMTRVYLGAHHTTDVMAGICGGAAWAFLLASLFPNGPRRPS